MELIAITIFIILAAISPGPDFAIVTKNSLCYSRRAGIFTAAGVSASLIFHASYCLLGLALIISKSLLLFSVIKYIGAGYLIYLGIKGLIAKRSEQVHYAATRARYFSPLRAFTQGFLCNALNPKAILFLLAFFTLIIKPGTPIYWQIIYTLEIAIIHLIWFSLLAIFLTHKIVQHKLSVVQHAITKVLGGFLVACGVRVALLTQE